MEGCTEYLGLGLYCLVHNVSSSLITLGGAAATIIDTATVIKDFTINPVVFLVSMAVGVIFISILNKTFTTDVTPYEGTSDNNLRFSAGSLTIGILPSLLTLGNNVSSFAVKFFFGSCVSGLRMGAMAAIAFWHLKSLRFE